MDQTLSPPVDDDVAQARPARKWSRLGSRTGRHTLTLVILVLIWALSARGQPDVILPGPGKVAARFWDTLSSGDLPNYSKLTLQYVVVGLAIGFAIALVMSCAAAVSKIAAEVVDVLTGLFNPLPAIALLPLTTIWFGVNQSALIAVTIDSALWPVIISIRGGFRAVPASLVRAASCFGIGRVRAVITVLIPASIPHLMAGVRNGWAMSWRTAVSAELIFGATGGKGGLGWFIGNSQILLDTDDVMVGLVAIVILGLVTDGLLSLIERATWDRWQVSR